MLIPQLSSPCGGTADITDSLLNESVWALGRNPAFVYGLSVSQFPLLVFMSTSERLGSGV